MDYYLIKQKQAAEKVAALLKLPVDVDNMLSVGEYFDPWDLFLLYGTYSSDFDECAIEVLEELRAGRKVRDDLGAEMFREMLCNLELCDYGTSPRHCWPTGDFKPLLPEFIDKWKAFSATIWKEAA